MHFIAICKQEHRSYKTFIGDRFLKSVNSLKQLSTIERKLFMLHPGNYMLHKLNEIPNFVFHLMSVLNQ